ncbi:5'/3'-nucleotidase SurE [Catenovulum agarivorans]|uniref:5'/3'-nucleotidase SurE n=1 Tax=Catenovulum agarivorans TaxID=1172192 RepID=UPI0002E6500D|nr:5'/3'-nucleotidase SurE [Catenovulum agarivorans]
MKKSLTTLALLAAGCISTSSHALNILVTNDDSWHTKNIQTLFDKLKAAGHNVIMSAPCTGQSGKGGAIHFLKAVNVDTSQIADGKVCVGDTDETVKFEDFVEGTPVMAALYGIDVLAQQTWNAAPDLVISGPNEGNNLGYMTNNSGTLGAANVSIARGLPAIAVSADTSTETDADVNAVADAVVEIVAELVANQQAGQPLLPKFTGLNVNTPADMANVKGYKFTQVGWNAGGIDVKFAGDLSADQVVMGYVAQGILAAGYAQDMASAMQMAQSQYAGKAGVSIERSTPLVDDENTNSEGNAIAEGYITISTIEANVQATQSKTAWTRMQLNGLVD